MFSLILPMLCPRRTPGKFQDVRRAWRSFLYRLKKWKKGAPFDYVYLIEGRHGDHRYHIHLVLRDSDFSPLLSIHFSGGGSFSISDREQTHVRALIGMVMPSVASWYAWHIESVGKHF